MGQDENGEHAMTSAQIVVTAACCGTLIAYVVHAIAFDRELTKQLRRYRNGKQEQDSERGTDSGGPQVIRRWGGHETRVFPGRGQGDG
jgi:hypothetical protein